MTYQQDGADWQVQSGGRKLPLREFYRGRPTYLYCLDSIRERVKLYQQVFKDIDVHYAIKANNHPQIIKFMKSLGCGFDVVSLGEIQHVLSHGAKPEDVVFSGVGKTVKEIEFALQHNISQLNLESEPELDRIIDIAKRLKRKVRVAIRFNPDVDVVTHPYIRTGFRENKFGLDEGLLPLVCQKIQAHSQHVELVGLTLHIGSQIQTTAPFLEAIQKAVGLCRDLQNAGHKADSLDIGGGLGIFYAEPDEAQDLELLSRYAKQVRSIAGIEKLKLMAEPGRFLVARAGVLLTEVQYVKRTAFKNFLIVDTGMHHLLRPALYSAQHRIANLTERKGEEHVYDVVGPICESSDVLGRDRRFTEPQAGDILAIFDSGAYGYSMSSGYNMHQPALEVCLLDGKEI